MELKTTELHRYLQSGECRSRKLLFNFKDEFGKITIAKYYLVWVFTSKVKELDNYIWRLDGRSVRYMKRVKIIENLKRSAKLWKR